jgi:tetratricopeptide (TPR) repeat protein
MRLQKEVETLKSRIAHLESGGYGPAEEGLIPVEPVKPLAAEVEYLESRVNEIEEAMELLVARMDIDSEEAVPVGLSAEVLANLIKRGTGPDKNAKEQRRARRIALCERFLQDFPGDPKAPDMLNTLIGEYIYSGKYDVARERLDSFAPLVKMEAWHRNSTSANLYSLTRDYDAARREYNLNINMPDLEESRRAESLFFHAYTYFEEGRYKEAIFHFQALIDRYGDEPPPDVKSVVAGAKTHIEKVQAYLEK